MSTEVPSLGWLGTGRMGAAWRDGDFLCLYDRQARAAGLGLESEG